MDSLTVRDIMTKQIVTATPDEALVSAARKIASGNFDGVPVVDGTGTLVGILTEYDLISRSSALHLPTFQIVLEHLPVLKQDKKSFQREIGEIAALTVRGVMNTDPLTLRATASYDEAVVAFRDHHRVNPIPVIDDARKVIGVVSRFDILKPLREMERLLP